MIELIACAASNRRRHFNKERAKSQLQPRRRGRRRRRQRPRRGSHFFPRVRARPPRPVATGCGTRFIVIPSISPPTRLGVLNKHRAKAIGSTAAVCVTLATVRRLRPRRRRASSPVNRYQLPVVGSLEVTESRSQDRDRRSEKNPSDLTIWRFTCRAGAFDIGGTLQRGEEKRGQ